MESAKKLSSGSDSEPLFGEMLRKLRRAAGFTQEELAERAQLSQTSLSDLERGANHHPRRETVLALADALNLSAEGRVKLLEAARRPGKDVVVSITTPPQASEHAPVAAHPSAQSAEHHGTIAVQIFMIADIRGYTRYTYEHGDEDAARLAIRFAAIAEETVVARGGQVLRAAGGRGDVCLHLSARCPACGRRVAAATCRDSAGYAHGRAVLWYRVGRGRSGASSRRIPWPCAQPRGAFVQPCRAGRGAGQRDDHCAGAQSRRH
jgi:transcriptional regulator with XRE-family HTH domain